MGLSEADASLVYATLNRRVPTLTGAEALSKPERFITTSCFALDGLLGSGIPLGRVTEVSGVPGIGKTGLAMQLCVNVQIPAAFGGAEGEAVYIDTEGSLVVGRLAQLAQGTADIVNASIAEGVPWPEGGPTPLDRDVMLSRIHYFRVYSHVEQMAILQELEDFLPLHPRVRCVVVDSVSAHFRQTLTDMAQRSRLLHMMAASFRRMASQHDVAVVLANQMTTRMQREPGQAGEGSVLVPALGDAWGHCPTNRIILLWRAGVR